MSCQRTIKQLRSLMLNLDLSGEPPTFRILGNQKFNTILGTIVTFLVIFLTATYLVVGIKDLIAETSPNVVQSDRQVVQTNPFPLLRNNFTLAITLTDTNLQPTANVNKYFRISLKNCKITRVINETTKTVNITRNCPEIPLEACTMDHFLTQTQINYFSLIKIDSFQCIQKDYWDSNPPILQGIATSQLFQSLSIEVSMCQNTTTKHDCASLEDIKQFGFGFYGVHMSDTLLQMDRPGEVALDIINLQYNTFSIYSSKQIVQQFKLIDTFTDTGIAFTDYQEQQTLIQDTNRESAEQYNSQYLILQNIYLSSKYSQFTRCYLKIQVILSRVGGLYQMIFLLVTFLTKGIVQLLLDVDMANEIYRFGCNEKQNQRLSLKRISVVDGLTGVVRSRRKLQSSRDSDRLNESELNESINNVKIQHQDMDQYIKQKDQIEKGFIKILLIFFGCDKKTKKFLEIAKEKYMDQLDIKNIIKKLYEVDQLKKIILNDEQQKLFCLLPKPNIVEESEQKFENQFLSSQQLQEGYDAFQKLVAQGNKSFVDFKIIQQLDPDIYNIYQSVQKASNTCNQFLNEYPLNISKRKLDSPNIIINSLQDIEVERDFPLKVYVQTPKFQK